jgi:hypothetical protein
MLPCSSLAEEVGISKSFGALDEKFSFTFHRTAPVFPQSSGWPIKQTFSMHGDNQDKLILKQDRCSQLHRIY